jgi:predicted ferric reductase
MTLYFLVLITPLILMTVFRPQTDHSFTYELGKNFAVLGYTILTLQFVLAARLKWVERPFGLDIVLQFHRIMGSFAAVLLVFHPLVLALEMNRWELLYGLDRPWYIWAGRAVLLLLLLQIFLSVFRLSLRLEFEKWRQSHNILALVLIAGGFLHSWFAGGDLALVPMQILWVGLLILAIGVFLEHRWWRPRRLDRSIFQIIDVIQETHNVWTIKMAPKDEGRLLGHLPGQFHFITLGRDKHLPVEEHPFTISSSPTQEGFISSTIKESGDFTATIRHTRPGDLARVHGPFGRFCYLLHSRNCDLVFIAGGVGITPPMSMLRYMRDTREDIQVTLVYVNKTRRDIIFDEELSEMEKSDFPKLRVIHILSRPDADWDGETGRLDGKKIQRYCGNDLAGRDYYLCGPPQMTRQLIRDLRNLGVPETRIHLEKFSL